MSFIDAQIIADRINNVITATGKTQFNVGSFKTNIGFMTDYSDGHSWVDRLENEILMSLVIDMLKDISYPQQNSVLVPNELTQVGVNFPSHTLTGVSITPLTTACQAGAKGQFGNWKANAKSFGVQMSRQVTAAKTKLTLTNPLVCKIKTAFVYRSGQSWNTHCVDWQNTEISQTADFATCYAELMNLHMLWKLAI